MEDKGLELNKGDFKQLLGLFDSGHVLGKDLETALKLRKKLIHGAVNARD